MPFRAFFGLGTSGAYFSITIFLGATFVFVLFVFVYGTRVCLCLFVFCALCCSGVFLFANLQVYRERLKVLHSKITARNERIKLLMQRGSPDLEPLDPA